MSTPPSTPSDNTTLTAVLRGYERDGYVSAFQVGEDGELTCGACGRASRPDEVEMPSLRRLEGASDPADMSAVLALACPHCGAKGTVVVRYGPEAEPGEAALLLGIDDVRSGDAELPASSPSHETGAGN